MALKFTTLEIAEKLNISERTVRRRIEKLVSTEKGRYEVAEEIVELIRNMGESKDGLRTAADTSENNDFDHIEYFTDNEYQEFHKRLSEYPFLKEQLAYSREFLDAVKNELEYHKSAYLRQLDIHEKMIDSVRERNFIEAKEKGMDKNDSNL